MPLATEEGLKLSYDSERINQLATDASGDSDSQQDPRIDKCIDSAEAIVKGYLTTQYTATQIEADNMCIWICEAIAMYFLESRRADYTDAILMGYRNAMDMLALLRTGKMKLGAVDELLPSIAPATAPRNIFTQSGAFDGLPKMEYDTPSTEEST